MTHWTNERTFELESFVSSMHHMSVATQHDDTKKFFTTFNISANLPDSPFTQFYTWLGRCYVLQFDFLLHPPSFIGIYFNLTEVGRLAINAHNRYNEIGHNYGYWPIKPTTFVLDKQDVQVYLEYTKVIEVHKRNEGTKECLEQDGYDHSKCVTDWARTKFKAMWKKEGTVFLQKINSFKSLPHLYCKDVLFTGMTPCWWTNFHYLVMDQNLPLCRNNDTIQNASYKAHDIYRAVENPQLTGCPKSCRQTSYRPDLTVQPSSTYYDLGKTGLFIYMSGSVETVEEYLLFDASEIITAVGGSLGLFLGFSCLSVISYFGSLFARFNICKPTGPTVKI